MSNPSDLLGLGVESKDLTILQVALRALIVYVATLIIVRLGNRRFLAKLTAFDVILGFMLGSMMARAVNGSSPLWPTLVAGLVLVSLHRIIATFAFFSDPFGNLVEGKSDVLVRHGNADYAKMKRYRISQKDLIEAIRLNGSLEKVEEVGLGIIERNGKISAVPKGK